MSELLSFQCIARATFDLTTLTGTYQPLNGAGFSDDIKILEIYNGSAVGVDISFDGVNDHTFWPSGATLIIDFQTNHSDNASNGAGTLNGRKGQIIWVKPHRPQLNFKFQDIDEPIFHKYFRGSLPPGVVETITGNTGTASPTANNINLVTANTTVKFVGSGSTITQDFGLTNILIGNSGTHITSAEENVCVGLEAGSDLTTGEFNCFFGVAAGQFTTTGTENTFVGANAGNQCTLGSGNTCIGQNSGNQISFGINNITLGNGSGSSISGPQSNCIMIGNNGASTVNNNVMLLGTQGTGAHQVNQTYIAGVINTVSGRVVNVTNPGAFPYTTLITDYALMIDTSVARTINLIASPVTGTTYRIKDSTGNAALNNITITPIARNIDGAASYVINSNYGSVDIIYSGTEWKKVAIAINGSGSTFTWNDATGATQALAVQNGYITDRGGGVSYSLPTTASIGDTIKIVGKLGIAVITPNANQQILIGSTSGSVGVGGTATANNVGDCIELICITAGASSVYRANSVVGTWSLA